jgi:hypothetical protein
LWVSPTVKTDEVTGIYKAVYKYEQVNVQPTGIAPA